MQGLPVIVIYNANVSQHVSDSDFLFQTQGKTLKSGSFVM